MFTWDDNKARSNERKHGVSFQEALSAFADSKGLEWQDEEHSESEDRFMRVARSSEGRVLFVDYAVWRFDDEQETIRIISARKASRKERTAYAG
jgi:uncharacterized protein